MYKIYNPHFYCCCFLEEVESCGKVCVWALSTLSPSDWVWFSWLGFCWCHSLLAAACTLHRLLNTSLRQMPSPVVHSPALWPLPHTTFLHSSLSVSWDNVPGVTNVSPPDTAVVTRAPDVCRPSARSALAALPRLSSLGSAQWANIGTKIRGKPKSHFVSGKVVQFLSRLYFVWQPLYRLLKKA